MSILTFDDLLAIPPNERERLIEADDAIRDVAAAIEDAAQSDGLDARRVAGALAGVMVAAAARQALTAYPSMTMPELGEAFATLAAEAFEWAIARGNRVKRGGRARRPATLERSAPSRAARGSRRSTAWHGRS